MRATLLLLTLALSGGCSTEPTECASLDADACEADEACSAIGGREIDTDADPWCVDFSAPETPMGCGEVVRACDEAETLAAPAADPAACVWFSNGCIPEGWVACDAVAVGECPSDG